MKGLTIFIKILGTTLLVALAISLGWTWFKIYFHGQYWNNASVFLATVVGLVPVYIAIALFYILKYLYKLKLQ